MDHFELIDMETWPRAEIYKQYTELWTTVTYSITRKLSAAKLLPYLKQRGIKLAPTLIWLTGREINRVANFRLGLRNKVLGRWDVIHPLYPTLNSDENMTFHSIPFDQDFRSFYDAYLAEQAENRHKTNLWATPCPENYFFVSIFPWLHFEGMSMQLKNASGYYSPYIALGKYDEDMIIPCMVMANHAAIDAYHFSQFFDGMQAAMDDPAQWCF